MKKITVIGAAIMDVVAHPASRDLFDIGSIPMEHIGISYGGDALNESSVLALQGAAPRLLSNIGNDDAGRMILQYCRDRGIDTTGVVVEEETPTGVNVVLSDKDGERYFLTNPRSCLRTLSIGQILPGLDDAEIVSYASIFVSERMPLQDIERLFREIKDRSGAMICADMTKAKHGEHIEDLKGVLPYVDYILPNHEEIALLTHCDDIESNAQRLVEYGARCAVVKAGRRGCYIRTREEAMWIPAYPDAACVDTTGAGDTFAGGFLYALANGFSLREAGCYACAAASFAVEHVGAVNPAICRQAVEERYCRICDIATK